MKINEEIKTIKKLMNLNEGFLNNLEVAQFQKMLKLYLKEKYTWFITLDLRSISLFESYNNLTRLTLYGDMFVNKTEIENNPNSIIEIEKHDSEDPKDFDVYISDEGFKEIVEIFSFVIEHVAGPQKRILVDLNHLMLKFISF